jgi:undecaprenyl-diphosphatase
MIQRINSLDQKIVLSLNSFFAEHCPKIIDKIFAEYLIYLLPIILIVLWFYSEKTKKVAMRATFSVILAWPVIAGIIGRLVNRPRPFNLSGVQELIFHRPDYSFPSDHAAALFAVAFSFWFSGYKKLGWAIFAMAIVVSFFRVATAIHYPTDILGGLAVGLLAAYLINLLNKPLDTVYNFILKICRAIKLA